MHTVEISDYKCKEKEVMRRYDARDERLFRPRVSNASRVSSLPTDMSACTSVLALFSRYAGKEEHDNVSVLPGAVRRRHLHDTDTQTDALLLFQPDRALRADIEHGPTGLHPAARFRREAHLR